jgi:protein HIRA/HIR1
MIISLCIREKKDLFYRFPVSACVMRGASAVDAEFVGHRREVTCARFLPRILLINGRRRCLLAIGSKDRTLSLWLTSPRQPMCIVNDFFASGILDLSWCLNDENGLITLGICSPDGACAFIIFTKGELGTPLTRQEMAKFYSDLYKVDIAIPTKTITNGLVILQMFNAERLFLLF